MVDVVVDLAASIAGVSSHMPQRDQCHRRGPARCAWRSRGLLGDACDLLAAGNRRDLRRSGQALASSTFRVIALARCVVADLDHVGAVAIRTGYRRPGRARRFFRSSSPSRAVSTAPGPDPSSLTDAPQGVSVPFGWRRQTGGSSPTCVSSLSTTSNGLGWVGLGWPEDIRVTRRVCHASCHA